MVICECGVDSRPRFGVPDPEAEVVFCWVGGRVDGFACCERGIVGVFCFDSERGFDEPLLYEACGHGEELPVDMHTVTAADFPCDRAHGVFTFVD